MSYVIFFALAEALCVDQINPNISATLVSSIACVSSWVVLDGEEDKRVMIRIIIIFFCCSKIYSKVCSKVN